MIGLLVPQGLHACFVRWTGRRVGGVAVNLANIALRGRRAGFGQVASPSALTAKRSGWCIILAVSRVVFKAETSEALLYFHQFTKAAGGPTKLDVSFCEGRASKCGRNPGNAAKIACPRCTEVLEVDVSERDNSECKSSVEGCRIGVGGNVPEDDGRFLDKDLGCGVELGCVLDGVDKSCRCVQGILPDEGPDLASGCLRGPGYLDAVSLGVNLRLHPVECLCI